MVYYLLLTEACNLSCSHCIRGEKNTDFLSLKDARYVIKKLYDYSPNAELVLTGGEPTLHPNFLKILDIATEVFKNKVAITTNGCSLFWRESYPEVLKDVKVQVSLDGECAAHEEIRGIGTFLPTIKTIENLRYSLHKVSVASVVSSKNQTSILELAKRIVSLKPMHWTINPILPYGFVNSDLEISVKDWNRFVDNVNQINVSPVPVHIKKMYDEDLLAGLTKEEHVMLANYMRQCGALNCGVARKKLYIYPDLTIYGCTCLKKYPFGNLHQMTVQEALNTPNACYVKQAKLLQTAKCNRCKYLDLCNGGCLGMSVHKFSSIGHGDSRCPIWSRL